jgi:hypothetical protein
MRLAFDLRPLPPDAAAGPAEGETGERDHLADTTTQELEWESDSVSRNC